MHRLFLLLALIASLLLPAAARANPIEPEKAFAMRAQALDAQTIEVVFEIAKDYYLYGDKFRFEAEPAGVGFGAMEKPAGKKHKDDFFGEVETHRGELRILVPVQAPAGTTRFELFATSQGCWDGGICYPPTTQQASIDLAAPPKKAGGFLDSVLGGRAGTGSAASPTPVALAAPEDGSGGGGAVSSDESGDIARLLSGASVPIILLSFFGFGLLLAFTPCVFPMIPILSGIIAGQGNKVSHMRAFVLSLAYVLGMAVTYALAGVAAGMTGTMLSAALQNVWVLSAFALMFVLLSLSMFGFYELGLSSALQSRLVTAESISQALQFVVSGNAELGFIAYSQIHKDGRLIDGSYWIVPSKYHSPIRQDLVVLEKGQGSAAVAALAGYLKSDAAKAVIKSYGYDL